MKKKWILFALLCVTTGTLFLTSAFTVPVSNAKEVHKRLPDYPLPFSGGAVRHGSPLIVTVQWNEINLATYGISTRPLAIVVRKYDLNGFPIAGTARTYYVTSNSNASNVYDTDYVHVGNEIMKATLYNQGYENVSGANSVTFNVQP
ncbi:hypothetical protein HB364_12710 [Pseudoflavitalea sp. X16]|uniref:hypothetical protein n=1 Tax=Paraflavitalea devenefica TaxID=2716334 RepID=UPI001421D7AA|nr:hypothetical protein [Paraflavitalea devenefica]NII25949.1 hypothetical protein [Paraflavitalea devenefica]